MPSIIPDHVAYVIAQNLPGHVREAVVQAADARRAFHQSFDPARAGDRVAERQRAQAVLTASNKILAAHNPKLVMHLTAGGVR